MQNLTSNRFMRFLLVGGICFVVDASIFFLLQQKLNIYFARLISFAVAVTIAWILNRCITFKSNDPNHSREWARYTMVNTIGGGFNYFFFLFQVSYFTYLHHYPLIALFISSATTAIFNYFFSKRFAFTNASWNKTA